MDAWFIRMGIRIAKTGQNVEEGAMKRTAEIRDWATKTQNCDEKQAYLHKKGIGGNSLFVFPVELLRESRQLAVFVV